MCDSVNVKALMLYFASKCYKIVLYIAPGISECVNYLKVQQYKGTSWYISIFLGQKVPKPICCSFHFYFKEWATKDLFLKGIYLGSANNYIKYFGCRSTEWDGIYCNHQNKYFLSAFYKRQLQQWEKAKDMLQIKILG